MKPFSKCSQITLGVSSRPVEEKEQRGLHICYLQEILDAFIEVIKSATGRTVERNLMPIQPGDVHATWADARLIEALVGALPRTDIRDGVKSFVDWYRGWNDR